MGGIEVNAAFVEGFVVAVVVVVVVVAVTGGMDEERRGEEGEDVDEDEEFAWPLM